ncbi:uncharacterized protein K460DRAFT_353188 [Cucurbitaria berberidis CBS 394.84]|uniref:F-box domain-containing protein n=1 Tax=Cucurbitaria berberidis CBS 394.84 TaxID=1168544 RepID=A0A9P4GNC4_9PLEO|nr:uncharacterized protein K460DRAFT_353188 [Cucurbitaria berberidis CBS 394.84]KAF1848170.1 hypothetical protein K460DRAFT_353188 [Cucurbitaria berberidis CBS 394.84]
MSDQHSLRTEPSKRKAWQAWSSQPYFKRGNAASTAAPSLTLPPNSLLGLPSELRLMIYAEVAGNDDPVIEFQPLLRICKLIKHEVSSDLVRCATQYLQEVESNVNNGTQARFKIAKPRKLDAISSIDLILPLSVFMKDPAPALFRHRHVDSTYTAVLDQLSTIRRRHLTIKLDDDREITSTHTAHKFHTDAVTWLCFYLLRNGLFERFQPLETTITWGVSPFTSKLTSGIGMSSEFLQKNAIASPHFRYGERSLTWCVKGSEESDTE